MLQVYRTRPHGMKYPDGTYADDYMMCKSCNGGIREETGEAREG